MNNDIFDRAIVFAVNAHKGQTRKSGGAYIVHPLEVACIAATMTSTPEVLSAAVLHDTVEDTDASIEDIEREFGKRVAFLVSCETEDKRAYRAKADTWTVRKQEAIDLISACDDRDALIVCLSDRLANMRSFYRDYLVCGDSLWQKFNQNDPALQYWFYNSMAQALRPLSDTQAWQEYNALIGKVFLSNK